MGKFTVWKRNKSKKGKKHRTAEDVSKLTAKLEAAFGILPGPGQERDVLCQLPTPTSAPVGYRYIDYNEAREMQVAFECEEEIKRYGKVTVKAAPLSNVYSEPVVPFHVDGELVPGVPINPRPFRRNRRCRG